MLLLLFLLAVLSFTVLFLRVRRRDESFCPPPGLKGLPFIGNLHQFDFLVPHVFLAKLAKIYGPVLSLRFGCTPVIVVQSAKTAKEVLKTQDQNFCGRPQMVGTQKLSYNGLELIFNQYNETYRELRKISVVHLLNSKRVQSFAPIRQAETLRLIQKISSLSSASQVINLSEMVMSFACSNMCRIAFGERYDDDDDPRSRFQSLLNEVQALFVTFFYSDYFPFLGFFLDKLNGQYSRLERTFKDLDEFYDKIINDHLDPNKPESEQEDFVDVLLRLQKDCSTFELTLAHIKALLMDMFVAGTDTSAAMVVWAMTELVKNPTVMRNVQQEIRLRTRNKGYVEEEDLEHLDYFKAVVKETLRLHPAAPLLVIRETLKKSNIEGYDILPGTLVYVNAWAIARDPETWKEPETFIPERFLGSSIDYKGQNFELIPFGAGRRICPGMHLGVVNMEVTLANLLNSFDWEVPVGVKKEDIDTDVLPGITMHKKNPLCLVAKKF